MQTQRPYLLSFALLLGLSVAVLWPTWAKMINVWNVNETYSHGWLIAPISAWLIYRKRFALKTIQISPSWASFILLIAAGLAWTVSQLAGVSSTAQLGLVAIVIALAMIVFGLRMSWELLFPLSFLFFMVPAGEGLNPMLMSYTADATVWALQASGIPVFREGMNFTLPTGRWSVVEACSGLRYVIAAGVLAILFAHLNYRKLPRQLVFVAICLLIAIFANYLRAYTVVLVGHFSNMRYGTGDDHVWYGWVFFGLVMMATFYLGLKFADTNDRFGPIVSDAAQGTSSKIAPPLSTGSRKNLLAVTVTAIFIVFGIAQLPDFLRQRSEHADDGIASRINTVSLKTQPFTFKTGFQKPKYFFEGKTDDDIHFSISSYTAQHKNGDMLAFNNRLIPEDSRDVVVVASTRPPNSPGLNFGPVSSQTVRAGLGEFIVLHWYVVDGQTTSSPYVAKALKLRAVVYGRADTSTSVAMAYRAGSAPTTERLQALVDQVVR